VLSDITKQLGEMFLKWALFGMGGSAGGGGGLFGGLMSLFGGLFGGGGVPGIDLGGLGDLGMLSALGGFASGGAVAAGVPIMVGESGPEIFTPSTAGAILPSGTAVGPTAIVNYYIDARGSSITEEQFRRSLAESENRSVQRSLNVVREVQART